ncbi:MAG: DUF2000 domain-containing protein [Candidatus Peribacteraceae bacterium]|jgi:hypothetical protein|nr:DUF2000 domain-containing protein [Candidatus Peribacteraceae bacterium]MDP7645967.1 DUF2000 domain-containing protein [Candidatus Peribacteraceae bacterium]
MANRKFTAVLNKKIESGKVMNALAHMTAGLVGNSQKIDEMGVIDYADKDGGPHIASKHPFIILKADNSNKIRTLREAAREKGVEFASFTQAMTVGTWEEQMAASTATTESDLEYYGICLFGEKSVVEELTKKFSIWN